MATGKTIALTRWTFFGKVISLFFNMLSRFVITFLPKSKCLLISWVALVVKNLPANAGDLGSILELGISPGEGNGYPLQYSGLENSMDYTVHGVAKSQTWLKRPSMMPIFYLSV